MRSIQIGHAAFDSISRRGVRWLVFIECYVCLACVYASIFLFSYAAFRLNDALLASWASNYMFWSRSIVITSHPNLLWFRSFVRVVHLLTVLFRPVCAVFLIHVLA